MNSKLKDTENSNVPKDGKKYKGCTIDYDSCSVFCPMDHFLKQSLTQSYYMEGKGFPSGTSRKG